MPAPHPLSPLRLVLCLWLLVGLAGCNLQPTPTNGAPDRVLEQRLTDIARWQIDGKLAVRTPGQAESARLQWQQDGDSFDIHLSGPAGLKATHFYGMPGGVRFEQGDRRESAGSVEAMSARLIGWPLPARQLTWWLRGLPAPGSRAQSLDYAAGGWLTALEQDDWLIRFSDHHTVQGIRLPGRIDASRADTTITLIIKQWQLP